jgi:nitrogen PTS system EIIA component
MKIVELISRDMIIPSLTAGTKTEILEQLAHQLASGTPGVGHEQLAQVLIDREGLASTAIGEGVAIPHGKIAGVNHIVACIGRNRAGVDFDSMDGRPTHLFFVMVAPESSTGAHLKALARISRVFRDREFRDRLLKADSADAMYDIIAEEDAKY